MKMSLEEHIRSLDSKIDAPESKITSIGLLPAYFRQRAATLVAAPAARRMQRHRRGGGRQPARRGQHTELPPRRVVLEVAAHVRGRQLRRPRPVYPPRRAVAIHLDGQRSGQSVTQR